MNLRTSIKLVLLSCAWTCSAPAWADDGDAGQGHQSYFKWFLEEIEVGWHRLKSGRGDAIASPVDSPDQPPAHLPGAWYGSFRPYYSGVIPSSTRWTPEAYVPYYRGYCKTGKVSKEPYHVEPCPAELSAAQNASDSYGPFAGAPQDEKRLLRLGGEGPFQPSGPDLIGGGAPPPEPVPLPPAIQDGGEVRSPR